MNKIIEKEGRKFFIVVMAVILLVLCIALAAYLASKDINLPGLGYAIGVLATTIPAYIGGNVAQKAVEKRAGQEWRNNPPGSHG